MKSRKLFDREDMISAYEKGFKASSEKWNGDHVNNPDDGIKLRKEAEVFVDLRPKDYG